MDSGSRAPGTSLVQHTRLCTEKRMWDAHCNASAMVRNAREHSQGKNGVMREQTYLGGAGGETHNEENHQKALRPPRSQSIELHLSVKCNSSRLRDKSLKIYFSNITRYTCYLLFSYSEDTHSFLAIKTVSFVIFT